MEQLQSFVAAYWIYVPLPFLIGIVKYGVDSLNIRDVEKVFFTYSTRMKLVFSRILVISFFSFGLILVLIYSDIYKDKFLNEIIVITVIVFIISFLLTLLIYLYVTFIYFIFGIKAKYKIMHKQVEWYVVRRINKDNILLGRGEKSIFVDWSEIKNEVITRENKEYERNFLFKYIINKSIRFYFSLLIASIGIILYLNLVDEESINTIIISLITLGLYTLLLLSFIAWNNEKIIKEDTELQ